MKALQEQIEDLQEKIATLTDIEIAQVSNLIYSIIANR